MGVTKKEKKIKIFEGTFTKKKAFIFLISGVKSYFNLQKC